MLHALARGPVSLGVFRFLLGIGEAGNWPAGVKVATEWFPVRERALASGIFNSGSSIGAMLAPPVVAWIVLQFGWPASFVLVGTTGFLWVAVWLAVYRSPPGAPRKPDQPAPLWRLARTPWMMRFTLSKVFSDPAWYFYIFWFPQYLSSARGFDLVSIGKYAWIPFVTADLGNFFGGFLAARLIRTGMAVQRARKVCVLFFAILMTASIPAVLVASAYVSIALISIATMGYTGALANMLAIPADRFPPHAVGSVWGLASMGAGFGGMVFSLITGWVVEHYSYIPVFFGFGVLPLIAAWIVWTLPGNPDHRLTDAGAPGGGD
ncbi:MAG: MFS transporter, partial [Acidobacteriota bacterium]|nr:MFS transporter [Acidobacteriota bacterium]